MVRILENFILLFQGENRLIFQLIVLVCVLNVNSWGFLTKIIFITLNMHFWDVIFIIRLFVIFNFYYLRNIYTTYMQDYF